MSGRIRPDLSVEAELFEAGADCVIGFDEVGRGALAGPVMVGAAALARPADGRIDWLGDFPSDLADSKLLSPHQRQRLRQPLDQWLTAWAVGSASSQEIDDCGISHALGLAALRALSQVEERLLTALPPDRSWSLAGILDGPNDYISKNAGALDAPALNQLPRIMTRVKADQACASVAAASVLAKLTRDSLMEELAERPQYAAYAWAANKGYGSQAHRDAIKVQGPSDLHRLSWHLV